MLRLFSLRPSTIDSCLSRSRSISHHSGSYRFNQGIAFKGASSQHATDSGTESGGKGEAEVATEAAPEASTSNTSPSNAHAHAATPRVSYKKRRRRLREQRSTEIYHRDLVFADATVSEILPTVRILRARPNRIIEDDFFACHRPLLSITSPSSQRVPWQVRHFQPDLQEVAVEEVSEDEMPLGSMKPAINEVEGADAKWAPGTLAYLTNNGQPYNSPRSISTKPSFATRKSKSQRAFETILDGDSSSMEVNFGGNSISANSGSNIDSHLQKASLNLKKQGAEEDFALKNFFAPLETEESPKKTIPATVQKTVAQDGLSDNAEMQKLLASALEAASMLPRTGSQGFLISILPLDALSGEAIQPKNANNEGDFNETHPAAVLSRLGILTPFSGIPPPPLPVPQSTEVLQSVSNTAKGQASLSTNSLSRTFRVEEDESTGKWTAKEVQIDETATSKSGRKLSVIDLIKEHIQSMANGTEFDGSSFFSRSFTMPTTIYNASSAGRKPRSGRRLTLGPRILAFRGVRILGKLHVPERRLYFAYPKYVQVSASEASADSSDVIWVDSVKRKRKLKMNKHKIKKRRKSNKAERKRLKK